MVALDTNTIVVNGVSYVFPSTEIAGEIYKQLPARDIEAYLSMCIDLRRVVPRYAFEEYAIATYPMTERYAWSVLDVLAGGNWSATYSELVPAWRDMDYGELLEVVVDAYELYRFPDAAVPDRRYLLFRTEYSIREDASAAVGTY